jgi:CheY-like chemotaxis protein
LIITQFLIVRPDKYLQMISNPLELGIRGTSENSCLDSDSFTKILLAEDEPSNQKVIMLMLDHLGYRAKAVANGEEALQAMEHQRYDVVIMDVKMPKMDGLQATQIIRQRWPNNGPKIIAVTAYALKGDKELLKQEWMGILPSPLDLKNCVPLLKLVLAYLDRSVVVEC